MVFFNRSADDHLRRIFVRPKCFVVLTLLCKHKLQDPIRQMFKYTKYLLDKIELLFTELGYTIRYERGSFQSGYCVVHQQKIAVVNKFFDTEARINTLLEILEGLEFDPESLSPSGQQTYAKVRSVLRQEHVE